MVPKSDANCAGGEKEEKEEDLEEIDPVVPDVKRHGCAGGGEGANQKDAVGNTDFTEKVFHEVFVWRGPFAIG